MVSVIVPIYNRENTIKKSIESILSQTYKDIEIIAVDDCSTDNSYFIVKKMCETESRLKIIKLNKNSGACVARNQGIDIARGEYIAFNDSDDTFNSDKIQKQLDYLQSNNGDLTFCQFKINRNNNSEILPHNLKRRKVVFSDFLKHSLCSTQTLFGKAECFKTVKFDNSMPRFQDWDLCIRLVKKYKIIYEPEPLVNVYESENSISKSNKKGLKALKLIFNKYKKDFIFHPIALLLLARKFILLKKLN